MSATDTRAQRTNPVSLADEEAVKKVVVDSILGIWDVVNNLTRLQPSRRDRYRVTIFVPPGPSLAASRMRKRNELHERSRRWDATSSLVAARV